EDAAVVAVAVRLHVPKAAVVPMRVVFPVEAVEDRIETDSFERDTAFARQEALAGDFFEPGGAADAVMAGLGNDHGAPIARVDFRQEVVERNPARVVGAGVPVQLSSAGDLPLIGGVEIDTDDIEVALGAAELGSCATRDHVPGFELAGALRGGRAGVP